MSAAWGDAVVVAAGGVVIVGYAYTDIAVSAWWARRKARRAAARGLVDAVAAGWVPSPSSVGLASEVDRVHQWVGRPVVDVEAFIDRYGVPPEEVVEPDAEALAVPAEHVEARPVDMDVCGRCGGLGMFVGYDERAAGWVVCGWCSGTEQRGVA